MACVCGSWVIVYCMICVVNGRCCVVLCETLALPPTSLGVCVVLEFFFSNFFRITIFSLSIYLHLSLSLFHIYYFPLSFPPSSHFPLMWSTSTRMPFTLHEVPCTLLLLFLFLFLLFLFLLLFLLLLHLDLLSLNLFCLTLVFSSFHPY